MKYTAQEVYDLVQETKEEFYYNYTSSIGSNQVNKHTGTEEYLVEDAMEGILEHCELDDNERNFVTSCYQEQVFNVCEDSANVAKTIKFIPMSQINTVFCILYGKDYVDIMTENL